MPLGSAVAFELAVLHTLAQLWYATTDQLHTTCFPDEASSRARLSLATLRAAGCLDLTPWRLPHVCQERGSVWTLTRAGGAVLAAYGGTLVAGPLEALDVPSTALERDEWRVRMAVRSLIVRLIVQARRSPLLADLRVQVRTAWPTPYAPPQPGGGCPARPGLDAGNGAPARLAALDHRRAVDGRRHPLPGVYRSAAHGRRPAAPRPAVCAGRGGDRGPGLADGRPPGAGARPPCRDRGARRPDPHGDAGPDRSRPGGCPLA